jgi:Hemerythrin HHE cation binding domain
MANPIDVIVAKTKGIEHSLEARHEGLVGVFLTLSKQHAEAKELMDRVNADSGKREALWPKIKVALVSHEQGELEAVYPELGKHEALKAFVAQHAVEADELSKRIDKLSVMAIDSAEWGSLFGELAASVVAHATEEENEIFPIALNEIGASVAKELDHAFKAAHKQVAARIEKH